MPLLSIIIPVYNTAEYLPACLESLKHQESSHFEVWLIDDGSTDGSAGILDAYVREDSRFHVIHKKNEGVGIARNAGIDSAQGEWLSFVDSDDYIDKDYVSSFLEWKETYDLVFFSLTIFNTKGEKAKNIEEQTCVGRDKIEQGLIPLLVNKANCEFLGFTVNKFFKKSIIDKYNIRFHPHLTFREDELFTTEYCKHITSFKAYSKSLYYYRMNPSPSLSNRKKRVDEIIEYSNKLLSICAFFTNESFLRLEYNRVLNFIINSYSPSLSKVDKRTIFDYLKNLVLSYGQYLNNNKKYFLLSKVYKFLPDAIACFVHNRAMAYFTHKNESQPNVAVAGELW